MPKIKVILKRILNESYDYGEIDLYCHFPFGGIYSARSLEDDNDLIEKINQMKKILNYADIRLRSITGVDENEELYNLSGRYFTDKSYEPVLNFPAKENQIHLVFLKGEDWNETEAKSSYISGPSYFGESIRNGILFKDSLLQGKTLAHEIGHYLGLYHSFEDHLEDTDGDNIMSYRQKELMYFSREQIKVMQGHPALLLKKNNRVKNSSI